MNIYLLLIFEFFKTGLFSIGGGLATLPFLFDMAEKYGWFTAGQLTNMIAISESTPGPIGINIATYVGYTVENLGILGALTATLSLVAPSIIVIIIIAGVLEKFRDSILVKNIFYGLRPAVVGLLGVSVLSIFRTTFITEGAQSLFAMVDYKKVVLFAVLLFFVLKFKKHPIFYIAAGAVFGILLAL